MKISILVMVAVTGSGLTLSAQETRGELDVSTPTKALDWNDPQWWETMGRTPSGLKLGKSDYVIQGPLIDTFRYRPRSAGKRSLRQRFFGLPFVNPLAPARSSTPMGREDYFVWGERDTPWATLADRPIPGPQSVLVSVSR